MTDRKQLAVRIEAASGPDRGLDAAIAREVGWGCVVRDPQAGGNWYCWRKEYRSGEWMPLPHYTASLDAAMMLVPEGHLWHVSGGLNWGYVTIESGDDRIEDFKGNAATPALALSAAAIRAGGA